MSIVIVILLQQVGRAVWQYGRDMKFGGYLTNIILLILSQHNKCWHQPWMANTMISYPILHQWTLCPTYLRQLIPYIRETNLLSPPLSASGARVKLRIFALGSKTICVYLYIVIYNTYKLKYMYVFAWKVLKKNLILYDKELN